MCSLIASLVVTCALLHVVYAFALLADRLASRQRQSRRQQAFLEVFGEDYPGGEQDSR